MVLPLALPTAFVITKMAMDRALVPVVAAVTPGTIRIARTIKPGPVGLRARALGKPTNRTCIFILVEGFPSVIVAVFAWIVIPDSPGRARFLTRRQRVVARLRMEDGRSEFKQASVQRFQWREVVKTLADPKAYMAAVSPNHDFLSGKPPV